MARKMERVICEGERGVRETHGGVTLDWVGTLRVYGEDGMICEAQLTDANLEDFSQKIKIIRGSAP